MSKKLSADPRSPSQRQLDEDLASGNWDGVEVEVLLTEEGASQILDHCRNLSKETEMNQTIGVESIRSQPFRWKEKVFRIFRCDYVSGEALVEVTPHDPEFVAELKKRIEQDRFHTLTYYQGFGFICFPEDYAKYQEKI